MASPIFEIITIKIIFVWACKIEVCYPLKKHTTMLILLDHVLKCFAISKLMEPFIQFAHLLVNVCSTSGFNGQIFCLPYS